ncbi:MAG: replication-associated recombination protein A [Erysipelotrichales bacterium]|nr:replication-associated recombination protein A [Erysipelotrichales bacterium]
MPFADEIRPQTWDDIVGQKHILSPNAPLRKIVESGTVPNLIFYGPPGTGKTTTARLIAQQSNMPLYKVNGTTTSLAEIRAIIAEAELLDNTHGILLYLDEIQYLNKKQQQSLLEYMENGKITLIASTTENPYFYIFGAILSRSTVFEFKPIEASELKKAITRAFDTLCKRENSEVEMEEGIIPYIAANVGGDCRKAMNTVELCMLSYDAQGNRKKITKELVRQLTQRSSMKYDKEGDQHYDLLSALQKSIRGSDENAALHYLARLLMADDLISPCRRLLVIASEDIGLAYPQAITIVKSCVDAALQIGLPEARIPLAQAVVLLATAPKSNSAYMALARAMEDIQNGKGGTFPRQLQNMHYDGVGNTQQGQNYKYPHDYPNHYVKQQYLPDDLKDAKYYEYGDNKIEQAAKAYWDLIKK